MQRRCKFLSQFQSSSTFSDTPQFVQATSMNALRCSITCLKRSLKRSSNSHHWRCYDIQRPGFVAAFLPESHCTGGARCITTLKTRKECSLCFHELRETYSEKTHLRQRRNENCRRKMNSWRKTQGGENYKREAERRKDRWIKAQERSQKGKKNEGRSEKTRSNHNFSLMTCSTTSRFQKLSRL